MSQRRLPLRALLLVVALLLSVTAAADITNASLEIQGVGLTVVVPDPPVTANLGEPTTVQTKFGGNMNEAAVAVEGLLAVGDLTGPGIDVPLELSTAPGHKFQIPGQSREGLYTLQNIRLMKGRELLQYASPSSVSFLVVDLFKTTVEVRQLSPEEIRALGIVLDARNYEVYKYTLSFFVNGQVVKIEFPVILDPRTRQVQAMPIIDPYKLPPIETIGVGRWTPPDIIPVQFEDDQLPEEERNQPKEPKEPGEKLYTRPPIPAAIVIPNSLAVLHQFFVVMLNVQNGAPTSSTARLENITARIKVPSQLRTVSSKPAVAFGQAVPIVDKVTGNVILFGQAKGEAEWGVEALKPGTHTIEIELKGVLKENGQEDVPLVARPRASVVVHDARFNIAFSHPDVVRKGVEYTTYSFVTNTSPATQTIRLSNDVAPCTTAGQANVCRIGGSLSDEVTIPSGETRTIEYRLRSGITGKVFATAATIESENAIATAQLHMGVSDSGIPLSPATLVMPHYAQYVHETLVSEYLRLLGLGYSLATSPATSATAKLPRVIKSDVQRRAVDIAQAGQAIFLANDAPGAKFDALAAMSIDLLGNLADLREWDALRRQEKYARPAGAAVTRQLEASGLENGASFETFIDNFGKALSHRDGYVAALVHGPQVSGNDRPYALSVRGATSGRRMDVPTEAESGWIRDLPYGELSTINAPQIGRTGELALVGRWTDEDLELFVTPSVSGVFRIELLFPDTASGTTRRAHLEVEGVAGESIRVPISRGAATINAIAPNGGFTATASSNVISLEPLRVVGVRQDLYLDENGRKASVLFNRPVEAGVEAAQLRTKFRAEIDFNKDGVVWNDEPRPISGAALQPSGRVIDLTFDHVLTTNASYTLEIDPLHDPRQNVPVSFPGEHVPKIDNDRPAGIIHGKFVRGDNTPLGNHEVILFSGRPNPETRGMVFEELDEPRRRIPINPFIEPPQIVNTRADGSYLFEYVPRELETGFGGDFRLWGLADGLTKYTYVDGAVRLPGRVHPVTLQLLGRGSAEGVVRYDNGEPVKDADVTVGSTAFEGVRSAKTDDLGRYRIDDLPVGPLAFTALDPDGNIGYAAGEIATPGEIEQQDISIFRQPVPKNGSIHGVIRRSDTNQPVSGARVGIFNNGYPVTEQLTDPDGRYSFERVPAGFISVVAAEWSISRESAATDFDLRGDEVRQVDLLLSVQPDEPLATITGEVLREDPLFPGNAQKYQRVANALVKVAGMRIVTADAEGRFEVPNVPLSRSGWQISAYDPATKRTESLTLPQLNPDAPNFIPILLKGLGKGTIRALLFDARGNAVGGAEMLVQIGAGYYVMEETDHGQYELGNIDVGQVGNVRTGTVPGEYGDQQAKAAPVRVAFDGQIASVSLRLPGQGQVRARLRGKSTLPNGQVILTPLIGEITLRYSRFNSTTLTTEIKEQTLSTNQGGLPGDVTFSAVPAAVGYSVNSDHPLGHDSQSGQLAYEGDLGDHTLVLSDLVQIYGTVFAIDGVTPVPNAQVRLEDGRQDQGVVTTGLDGKFEFLNVAPGGTYRISAESTQAGIYRVGERYGPLPGNGGVVETSVTLLPRGTVNGKIVYAAYKVYDPDHPENNVADDTPSDPSDNAPVRMARFYVRELDFPRREIGKPAQPLQADLAGRFAIDNVFVGRLRATAWSPENPDLRGDWTDTLAREGDELRPYILVGGAGTGALEAIVTNPNQQNAPVENAEVQLFRGGGLFDFASTDVEGKIRFEQLPVGTYVVAAYSKALGKSGRAPDSITVSTDQTSEARIMLTFSGQVTGRLTDPESTPANSPIPGSHVTISMAEGFQQRFTTTVLGEYLFEGVREGYFSLDAKDTLSNRRARATGLLSAADPAPNVDLELEPTETLHLGMYLPDDTGANSGVLAGTIEATVRQRGGEFHRALQGNPIVMSQLFRNEPYSIEIQEVGGEHRQLSFSGSFPNGNAANPILLHYPAYGGIEVLVRRNGAAMPDARVNVRVSRDDNRVFYSDSTGRIVANGLPLNQDFSITVTTLDGSSGSGTVRILRASVIASTTIEVGARATIVGKVFAEAGGPSIGTPVVIRFSGGQLSGTTDIDGRYVFAGVATTPSAAQVEMLFYGPDGSTLGHRLTFPLGNEYAGQEYEVDDVTLDATPPLLLDIAPAQGASTVPPDTHLKFVFSEPIPVNWLTKDFFALQPADSATRVEATFTTATGEGDTFIVTMAPKPSTEAGQLYPLKSNTLYRLTVSGAVSDVTGHPLGANRGLTFTTADYVEPRVIATVPAQGEPIPEQITYEFRFNEPLDPRPFEANGDGTFELARMTGPQPNGVVDEIITGEAYVDPFTGISLFFAPDDPTVANSFYRIRFTGVRDLQNNLVPEQTYYFDAFDTIKPVIDLPSPIPVNATLVSGLTYRLTPILTNETLGTPAVDIQLVEYFRVENGVETFIKAVKTAPFAYDFVAPDAPPAGMTLTFRAKAIDKSTNASDMDTLELTVKPNQPPPVAVALSRSGTIYAGEQIVATVTTTDEMQTINLQLDFRAMRRDGTEYSKVYPTTVQRTNLAAPWPTATFIVDLPINLQGGTDLRFKAIATDMSGLSANATTTLPLTNDALAPNIAETTPANGTQLAFGSTYQLSAAVTDEGTGVSHVIFEVDGQTYTVPRSEAMGGIIFTTPAIAVTAISSDTTKPVKVTAVDFNDNVQIKTFDVVYLAVGDPSVPAGEWLCPITNAVLPANTNNVQLKLRVRATDDVSVTSVRFRLPNSSTLIVPTSDAANEYAATVTINTPAAGSEYVITAIVSDANPAHTQEIPLSLQFVTPDFTIDSTQAIIAADVATYQDKTIVVKGAQGRLVPHVPVRFKNLIVLDGARVDTLPTTTSIERRLDLTITDNLYIDCASSIDVSGRGYLGAYQANGDGSGTRNESNRGRINGNTVSGGPFNAGGTHGGLGALGSEGSTNSAYGSYTAPRSLGAGGGGAGGATSGGGAVAITGGENAKLIVAGAIRANGSHGPAWSDAGAGAGGSVLLSAPDVAISRSGRITANGGDNTAGGGGRIAIHATNTLAMPEQTVQARGGWDNRGNQPDRIDGGAGTIYVVRPGETVGDLVVSSYDERHPDSVHAAQATPLGGVGTDLVFRTITVGPHALLRFDGPYQVTEVDGIVVDPTAALLDANETPVIDVVPTVPAGSNLPPSAPVRMTVSATADDGIHEIRLIVPGKPDAVEYLAFPRVVEDQVIESNIPVTATSGPVSVIVRVTSLAGRVTETTTSYTIVQDDSPGVEFFAIDPSSREIYAGRTIRVDALAADDLLIEDVWLESSHGNVTTDWENYLGWDPATRTYRRTFLVQLPVNVPADTIVHLTLFALDGIAGRSPATATADIRVLQDPAPPTITMIYPQPDDEVWGGYRVPIEATVIDAEVGVSRVWATLEDVEYELQLDPQRPNVYTGVAEVSNVEAIRDLVVYAIDYDNAPTFVTVPIQVHAAERVDITPAMTDADFKARTLAISGNTLLIADRAEVGSSDRVAIFDVTTPEEPQFVRSVALGTNHVVVDMEIHDGNALILTREGLSILNLANETVREIPIPNGTATSVAGFGNFAVVAVEQELRRYDIATLQLVTTQNYGWPISDLVAGSKALYAVSTTNSGWWTGGMVRAIFFDEQGNFSSQTYPAYNFPSNRGRVSGDLLVLTSESGGVGVFRIDANGYLLQEATEQGGSVGHGAHGHGSLLAMAAGNDGAIVYQREDNGIVELFDIFPGVGPRTYDVVFHGATLYAADELGIGIFRRGLPPTVDRTRITFQADGIDGTASIVGTSGAIGGFPSPDVELYRQGESMPLFTTPINVDGSFSINLTDLEPGDIITLVARSGFRTAGPFILGTVSAGRELAIDPSAIDAKFTANTVRVDGNRLYIASEPQRFTEGNNSSDKIVVYDITDPAAPAYQRTIALGDKPVSDFVVSNGHIFVGKGKTSVGGGLVIYDAANPTAPLFVEDEIRMLDGLALSGHYLFAAYASVNRSEYAEEGVFKVWDVSTPSAPRVVGEAPLGAIEVRGVTLLGNDYVSVVTWERACLMCNDDTQRVWIWDRRDLTNFASGAVTTIDVQGNTDVRVDYLDHKLYISESDASNGTRVEVYELRGSTRPQSLRSMHDPRATRAFAIRGPQAFTSLISNDGADVLAQLDLNAPSFTTSSERIVPAGAFAIQGELAYVVRAKSLIVVRVAAAPFVDANRISVTGASAGIVDVVGTAFSITGAKPLSVLVRNDVSGATVDAIVDESGAFTASIAATKAQTISVSATDPSGMSSQSIVVGAAPIGTAVRYALPSEVAQQQVARSLVIDNGKVFVSGNLANDVVSYEVDTPPPPTVTAAPFTKIPTVLAAHNGVIYTSGSTLDPDSGDAAPWNSYSSGADALAIQGTTLFEAPRIGSTWHNSGNGYLNAHSLASSGLPILSSSSLQGDMAFRALLPLGSNRMIALAPETTSSGQQYDVVIIDTTDPANLSVVKSLPIPQLAASKGVLVDSNLYIAGRDGGFAVVDLADPSTPVVRAFIPTPHGGTAVSIARSENIVAVSFGNAGVALFDITSRHDPIYLGTQPTRFAAYDLAFYGGDLYVANENAVQLYQGVTGEAPPPPAAARVRVERITVTAIDATTAEVVGEAGAVRGQAPLVATLTNLSTPSTPTVVPINADGSFVGTIAGTQGEHISLTVRDGYGTDAGPFDVGEVPEVAFEIDTNKISVSIAPDGRARITGTHRSLRGLPPLTVKLTVGWPQEEPDPEYPQPTTIVTANADGSFTGDLEAALGNELYLTLTDGNGQTLDPTIVGYMPFTTSERRIALPKFEGNTLESIGMYPGADVLILSTYDSNRGESGPLAIFDTTQPATPVFRHFIETGESGTASMTVGPRYAYQSTWEWPYGINVIDTTSAGPIVRNVPTDEMNVNAMAVANGHLFACIQNQLRIYDLTDPTNPQHVNTLQIPDESSWPDKIVTYADGYLYLRAQESLFVVDVRDPENAELQRIPWDTGVYALAIHGDRLLVTNWDSDLSTLLLTDPMQPELLNIGALGWGSSQMTVHPYIAALELGWDGIGFVNLTGPEGPEWIGRQGMTRPVNGLHFKGDALYMSDPQGLAVLGRDTWHVPATRLPQIFGNKIELTAPSLLTARIVGQVRALRGVFPLTVDVFIAEELAGTTTSTDGSFSITVPSRPHDSIELRVSDEDERSIREFIGQVPGTPGPAVQLHLLDAIVLNGTTARVTGEAGAISGTFPFTLELYADQTLVHTSTLTSSAAFSIDIPATAGMQIVLSVRDLADQQNGGAIAILGAPKLFADRIALSIVNETTARITGSAGAARGTFPLTIRIFRNNSPIDSVNTTDGTFTKDFEASFGNSIAVDAVDAASQHSSRINLGQVGAPRFVRSLIEMTVLDAEHVRVTGATGAVVGGVPPYRVHCYSLNDSQQPPQSQDGSFDCTLNAFAGESITLSVRDFNGLETYFDLGLVVAPPQTPSGPSIVSSLIHVSAVDASTALVTGDAGAVTGAYPLTIEFFTQGAAAGSESTNDGSFAKVVTASAGMTISVRVTDGDEQSAGPADVGVVPYPQPTVDLAKITLASDGVATATITGVAGAIGGHGTLTIDARNLATSESATAEADANGSFVVSIAAIAGDEISIRIRDTHDGEIGPFVLGAVPFGRSVTNIPITAAQTDATFRARTLAIDGSTLLVAGYPEGGSGDSSKIALFDISDPADPQFASTLTAGTEPVRGLAIADSHALVAAGDLVSLHLGNGTATNIEGGTGDATAIAIDGTYAFVASDAQQRGMIRVYDITDPAAPRFLREQTTSAATGLHYRSLIAFGDYLLALSPDTTGSTGHDVVVIDRRDPNALAVVKDLDIPQLAASRGVVVGSTLYLAGGNGGTAVVNLSNPLSPVVRVEASNDAAHAIAVAGEVMAIADDSAGVTFLDANPTPAEILGTQLTMGTAWDVAFHRTQLYVANNTSLTIIEGVAAPPILDAGEFTISTPVAGQITVGGTLDAVDGHAPIAVEVKAGNASPVLAPTDAQGAFTMQLPATSGQAISVIATDAADRVATRTIGVVPFASATTTRDANALVAGDVNFTAQTVTASDLVVAVSSGTDACDKLLLFDAGTSAAPQVLVPGDGAIEAVQIDDDWAFVASDGFATVDMRVTPAVIHTATSTPLRHHDVVLDGTNIFASAGAGAIRVYDVTDRAAPSFVNEQMLMSGAIFRRLLLLGTDHLLAVGAEHDFLVINRTNVNTLTIGVDFDVPSFAAVDAALDGNTLYLAGGDLGVAIVDLTNPLQPALRGLIDTRGLAHHVTVIAPGRIAVADGSSSGITFLDVTNPQAPLVLGSQRTPGNAVDVTAHDGYLHVATQQHLVRMQIP